MRWISLDKLAARWFKDRHFSDVVDRESRPPEPNFKKTLPFLVAMGERQKSSLLLKVTGRCNICQHFFALFNAK